MKCYRLLNILNYTCMVYFAIFTAIHCEHTSPVLIICYCTNSPMSWGSDGLRAGRPGFDSREGRDFCLLHSIQTGSGSHPVSYPMSTMDSFRGGKAAGTWSWELTSIQYRGLEWWNYNSTPPYVFITLFYLTNSRITRALRCTLQLKRGNVLWRLKHWKKNFASLTVQWTLLCH
jgi:hypothetical protein